MDKDAVLKIVQRFIEALCQRQLDPDKVILFGSYAKGTYHDGSDIDLVVVSDYFTGKTHFRRRKPIRAAVCELWEPIEAVDLTPEEWEKGDLMICDFAKEGEVVYEAGRRKARDCPSRAAAKMRTGRRNGAVGQSA